MVGVWEGLNLGFIPNFFLCFGMHPKIIDVYPKLIPKGGVIQFCLQMNFRPSATWSSSNSFLKANISFPMLMQMGLSPEATQAAYRVGDSITNIISPLMPYLPIIIVFAQKYDRKAGIGTILAAMLPYSIAFLIAWKRCFCRLGHAAGAFA